MIYSCFRKCRCAGSSHIFRARMAPIARMRLVNTLPKARSLSRTIYVQNGFESCLFQPSMQPLRQRPRLKSDLFYRKANRLEERNQGVMLTRDLRLFSRSFPARPQRTRSTVLMTRRFRHNAPWLSSVSRCLGPTQRRDPVSSSIGGQPLQLLTRSRAHYGI